MIFSVNSPASKEALLKQKPLRIGLLGCSDIAGRKFLPALKDSTCATFAAISSATPAAASARMQLPQADILSHEELLARTDLDLVYISLRNHQHEEWTIKALEAGKHVICEKPLATSLAAAQRMIAAAQSRSLLLYENLMYLHHPQHKLVNGIIASGRIGRIVSLRSGFAFPMPKTGNFRLDPDQGGGAFLDLSRYVIGTALHFLSGSLLNIKGTATWEGRLNTGIAGTAATSAGELFLFSGIFGQQYESYYEICCERGRIRLDRAYTTPADMANRISLLEGDRLTEIQAPAADHFKIMIASVAAAVNQGDFAEINKRTLLTASLAEMMAKGCLGE